MTDWIEVKQVYLQTRSYKLTAERVGLPTNTIKTRARREGWIKIPNAQGSNGGSLEPSGGATSSLQGSNGGSLEPSGGATLNLQGSNEGSLEPSGGA
ncbi:MAG: hypothetical protein WCS65_18550, partial [Verrucomicrobiae bacterium]